MEDCIFCKIVSGELPSKKVYEDDLVYAFHDIRPIAPVHFLIIPKVHVASLDACRGEHEAAFGRMVAVAGRLAREQGASDGFRSIINTGRVGRQEVYHVHLHVLGGPDTLPGML